MSKHWLRNMLMGLTVAVGIGVGLGHAQPVHAAEPTYTIGTVTVSNPLKFLTTRGLIQARTGIK